MSDEQNDVLDIDFSVCCPKADAPAQPYHAIMKIDEKGETDGTLWSQGDQLMLFDDCVAASKIIDIIGSQNFAIRGVSKEHLEALQKLQDSGRIDLFVIIGFTAHGDIEAMPLAEHQARMKKAGNPPPLPKKG